MPPKQVSNPGPYILRTETDTSRIEVRKLLTVVYSVYMLGTNPPKASGQAIVFHQNNKLAQQPQGVSSTSLRSMLYEFMLSYAWL